MRYLWLQSQASQRMNVLARQRLCQNPCMNTPQTAQPTQADPLSALAHRLREFASERDWDQFHSPKNLAMALVSEAGELAAEFQWMTEAQSKSPDAAQLARIRAESADVLNYLVRLADKLGIDLIAAANEKIDANARRYPAEKVRGSSKKYSEY
jgi:NTP pyrophosphatase (non-canonical NTP hydrolase)